MNRLIRVLFLCLAGLLLAFAALFAVYLRFLEVSFWKSGCVWIAVLVAGGFILAARRFSFRANARIFFVVLGLVFAEAFLQATTWLGIMPGLNTRDKVAYGRVYITSEGHGNSIRNREGWNSPEFDLAAPKKVAVIGDSLVEAFEVDRDKNEAAVLQQLLRAHSSGYAVLGLGSHGTSPAFYLQVLEYAQRHYAPQEAIVAIYLGNDISESSPDLTRDVPAGYIYYDLDSAGNLQLTPQNEANRQGFLRYIENSHRPLWIQAAAIVRSHCMLYQTLISIRDSMQRARKKRLLMKIDPGKYEMGGIGVDARAFAAQPIPAVAHATDIMLAELGEMQRECETNHVKLRILTIPLFPPQFYATQHGTNWTRQFGNYDFLRADIQVGAFAKSHDIPFLSFGEWLKARGTDVQEIQKLYFFNGSGHFTEQGHALCAEALYETFYAKPGS